MKKEKPHRKFRLFFRIQLLLLIALLAGCGLFFYGKYGKEIRELHSMALKISKASTEKDFHEAETSLVYAADGTLISTLKSDRDSYYLKAEDIPYNVKAAAISIEDKKFYDHKGVDYKAILRAIRAMIRNGEPTQGGSTITQQLARNIYLSSDRTWQRKMEEIFLARNLEKKYTKDQILEFYLNNIYFANGYYGIEAASRGYFNKPTSALTLSETAYLLAIPNSPVKYDPLVHPENTLARRDLILKNMRDDDVISGITYDTAINETITLDQPVSTKNVYVETFAYHEATKALMEMRGFPFLYDHSMLSSLQAEYDEAYGEMYALCRKELSTGGYRIYTTLDLETQEELQESIDSLLAEFTETNEEGVYALQSAGVCIENDTGYVTAIVGGRSQALPGYTLNRAYQSFRQPGSTIKPLIVYTPALERGYTPDTIVLDQKTENGPSNAGGGYAGEITLRQAVAFSKNTVAAALFSEITPKESLSYLDEMHFTHILLRDENQAAALGGFTIGASQLEMTSGYACIENDGKFRDPTCIRRITDAEGTILYEQDRSGEKVYKENAARQMTDMLETVMEIGTGKDMALSDMPCAGKTGTTNDHKDGWFIGYTRYYTSGIWVGYDMPREMSDLSGNTYPGRIWKDFMDKIHAGMEPLEFLPYMEIEEPEEPGFTVPEETPQNEENGEEKPFWEKPLEELTPEEHQMLWEMQLQQMQDYMNSMQGMN